MSSNTKVRKLPTLRYMSPEQALGNHAAIDGRTDVYALGATLYELLTLEPVFDGGDKQTLLRQIAFEEPRPLRQRDRLLPVELETILLKTLAKNPSDRYLTAGALANDLRCFLEQKPIQARRPTLMDRATKWALRNRRLVATAAVGLLLAVVTMAVSSLLIWNEQQRTAKALGVAGSERTEAQQQRQQAEVAHQQADEQTAIARAVNDFLQHDLLEQTDVAEQPGGEARARSRRQGPHAVNRASRRIESRFIDQPLVEAAIRETIGTTYRALWLFPEAEPHLLRARELRESQLVQIIRTRSRPYMA